MAALRTRLFRTPAAWLLLAVLALGLRALVPQGMMVEQSGSLELTVSVCRDAGIGPAKVTLDIPRKAQPPGHDSEKQSDCAFGALSQAATLPQADMLLAALLFVMALALAPVPRFVLHRLVHLRPPLRGPPILS